MACEKDGGLLESRLRGNWNGRLFGRCRTGTPLERKWSLAMAVKPMNARLKELKELKKLKELNEAVKVEQSSGRVVMDTPLLAMGRSAAGAARPADCDAIEPIQSADFIIQTYRKVAIECGLAWQLNGCEHETQSGV